MGLAWKNIRIEPTGTRRREGKKKGSTRDAFEARAPISLMGEQGETAAKP